MSNIKRKKINEKKNSNNERKQHAFTLCEGKGILSPFRGYHKATSSGRGCLLIENSFFDILRELFELICKIESK